jgi:hypothetical protein
MAKDYIPQKPTGQSPKWVFLRSAWDRIWGGKFPIYGDNQTIFVSVKSGEYFLSVKQPRSSSPVAPLSYGEWSPDATYNFNDIVKNSLGPAQGTYIYVNSTPSKGNLPWVGAPFWSQLIGGLTSMWQ